MHTPGRASQSIYINIYCVRVDRQFDIEQILWLTHGSRLGVHGPGLARALRIHGGKHSTSDLHRTVLRRRADPYLTRVHNIKKP
jgi:hypothetical protein